MKAKNQIKTSLGSKIFDIFNYTFITLFCISVLFPVWNMIVTSLLRAEDISYLNLNLIPKNPTLDAYKYCFQDPLLWTALRNSVARTILGTLYHLLVCCMAAYALTYTEMPFIKPITVLFLITMYFSGGLIPGYLNIKNLGLLDNFLVYIIPGGFSMYNTIIIRNYFFSIDKSMKESAIIDGATTMQTFARIILPLSTPVLATVGLWQLVGQWNSWFDNLIYVRSDSLITLQYMLRSINNNLYDMLNEMGQQNLVAGQALNFTPDSIVAATTVIVMTPIICVYPFLQKYFVKGIMLGAVKG